MNLKPAEGHSRSVLQETGSLFEVLRVSTARRALVCLISLLNGCTTSFTDTDLKTITVCELSRNFAPYRGRMVAVRGIYYYGLRQECPQKCSIGDDRWPAALDLAGSPGTSDGEAPVSFVTEQESWEALDRIVLSEAKKGDHVEIWVTAVGEVRTRTAGSPLGPCDRIAGGGYGHLGAFPAQLVIKRVSDMVVKPNPKSPYDYSRVLHPRPA